MMTNRLAATIFAAIVGYLSCVAYGCATVRLAPANAPPECSVLGPVLDLAPGILAAQEAAFASGLAAVPKEQRPALDAAETVRDVALKSWTAVGRSAMAVCAKDARPTGPARAVYLGKFLGSSGTLFRAYATGPLPAVPIPPAVLSALNVALAGLQLVLDAIPPEAK